MGQAVELALLAGQEAQLEAVPGSALVLRKHFCRVEAKNSNSVSGGSLKVVFLPYYSAFWQFQFLRPVLCEIHIFISGEASQRGEAFAARRIPGPIKRKDGKEERVGHEVGRQVTD